PRGTYNLLTGNTATVTDDVAGTGPDVYYSSMENGTVYLPSEPVHGFGSVTTTTSGATSAPPTVNEVETGLGLVRSIAFNPAKPTQLWVADNGGPAALHLIDT